MLVIRLNTELLTIYYYLVRGESLYTYTPPYLLPICTLYTLNSANTLLIIRIIYKTEDFLPIHVLHLFNFHSVLIRWRSCMELGRNTSRIVRILSQAVQMVPSIASLMIEILTYHNLQLQIHFYISSLRV